MLLCITLIQKSCPPETFAATCRFGGGLEITQKLSQSPKEGLVSQRGRALARVDVWSHQPSKVSMRRVPTDTPCLVGHKQSVHFLK